MLTKLEVTAELYGKIMIMWDASFYMGSTFNAHAESKKVFQTLKNK